MRNVFLSASLLIFIFTSSLSFAQENVSMRIGDRGDSARLVFAWDGVVDYKRINISDKNISIEFTKDANLSTPDFSAFGYINDIRQVSTAPLKFELSVVKGANIRDFKIGNRIILDIGKPKGFEDTRKPAAAKQEGEVKKTPASPVKQDSKTQQSSAKKEDKTSDETKAEAKKIEPEQKPRPAPKQSATEKTPEKKKATSSAMPAVPPAYVLVPETLVKKEPQKKVGTSKEKKTKQSKALKKAVEQEEHVVSLSATQNVDLSVFESFGKLWFVIDTKAPYVLPELSSPKPDLFSEPQKESVSSDGNVYSMTLPEQYMPMKATGSALVWNIVMGPKINEAKGIKPYRESLGSEGKGGKKLIWPMKYLGKVLDVTDPVTGQVLKVVTVNDATQSAGKAKSYADFDLLRSPAGMTIRPKVDDLTVKITDKGIEVYRPYGLDMASEKENEAAQIYANQKKKVLESIKHEEGAATKKGAAHSDNAHDKDADDKDAHDKKASAKKTKDDDAFLKFKQWQMADASDSLAHKKTVLLSTLNGKSETSKVEDLLTLGKMFLSYGRGAEALGFFDFASDELPELLGSAEFIALRGIARGLDWKSEAALTDLLNPKLDNNKEVAFWRSYVLADLGDWQQAAKFLPSDYKEIYNYPNNISGRLALALAEVALRDGKVKQADELVTLVEHNKKDLLPPFSAYLRYLKGESERQKGKTDKAKEIWEKLSKGNDDLYRTKAGLALTILRSNEKEIDNNQKIDALERLRYAWRGDELEAQVKYWLGDAYFNKNDYLKGLHTMRDGAAVAAGSTLGERIAGEMSNAFTKLFLENHLEDVSPLDAVALYDEFSELTPLGEDGNKLVQVLAEHLVKADLLPRAAKIMTHQVDHRLSGEDKVSAAIRLAAIRLMDKNPQAAVNALGKATNELRRISDEQSKAKYIRKIALLKTRAYLQNKQYDKALSLLDDISEGEDVNRLRADIAWQAGYWADAADAIQTVIMDEGFAKGSKLSEAQAAMLLNRAVALSLDNDRIALSNMRQKFIGAMKETSKARQFEVITRPRKDGGLADRETLMSIVSEVDMFQNFLDDIRKGDDLPAADN